MTSMKSTLPLILLALACFPAQESQAVPFRNLDFEAANLPTIPHGQYGSWVPIADALPGWNGFAGTHQISLALHNSVTLGAGAIWVWGPDWSYGIGGRIEGDFTTVLVPGTDIFTGQGSVPFSISQTGEVPAGSHWLLFKATAYPTIDAFGVFMNGQNVTVAQLATYSGYSLYGSEISSFAGNEAELRFTVNLGPDNSLFVDSIEFSPVPEPGPVVLLALGLAGLGLLRYRNRRCRRTNA